MSSDPNVLVCINPEDEAPDHLDIAGLVEVDAAALAAHAGHEALATLLERPFGVDLATEVQPMTDGKFKSKDETYVGWTEGGGAGCPDYKTDYDY